MQQMDANKETLKILLVDTGQSRESLVKSVLAEHVGSCESRIDGFRSALSAADALSCSRYDLVLVGDPPQNSNVKEVVEKIAGLLAGTPVVLITRLENENDCQEILKSGATDYLAAGQSLESLLRRSFLYALEHKKAEGKLKEGIETKTHYIATVAHELRTSLACMKNAVNIILEGIVGPINSEQKKFLDIAMKNMERLARLINSVLDFQRMETGKMMLNIQENDLSAVAREVYEAMAPFAKQSHLDFTVDTDDKLPKAPFDSDKITEVLNNLVHNAIKYTSREGKIRITTFKKGKEVFVRVSDTGRGIPKEFLSKIFEPFYRVQEASETQHGSGLGLSLVKEIVDMHSGRIEVDSEAGRGTTFTVALGLDRPARAQKLSPALDTTVEKILTE
jgi:signal transduction histidine kinase